MTDLPLAVEAWELLCGQRAFAQILDIREPDRFARGHLAGAVNVPYRDVQVKAAALFDPALPVLVVDPGGARAAEMAVFLRGQGLQAAYLEGGMARWTGPLEKAPRRRR